MPTFRPYTSYRKTDLPWLGQIPAHWEHKRIKMLCTVQRGQSPRPIDDPAYFDDEGEYSWVRISDVTASEKYLLKTEQRLTELGKSKSIPLEPGELVVSIAASVGKPIITGIKCCIHDGFVWLRGLKQNKEYFYYLLLSDQVYVGLGKTGTQLNLNSNYIGNIDVPLPPFPEQQAIAAYLSHQTAKIDALIARKEGLLDLLAEQRTAIISQAVTKGLNPDVKMKDSGMAWLGQVPSHWEVEKNKQVYREIDDRSEYGDEELLTVSHITGVTTRAEKEVNMFMAESNEGYKRCRAGDLAINTMWAWMGALGISRMDGIVSPSYNVYRFRKQNEFLPKYLDYLYRTPQHIMEIKRYSKGVWSSRLRLYPDEFFLIATPKPPYEEQVQIVEFLDKRLSQMNKLASKVEAAIELQREYRAALISSVVTGKVQVKVEGLS